MSKSRFCRWLKTVTTTTAIEADEIFHSGRGSVYTAETDRALASRLGRPSPMGKTVCWDNKMAQSFLSALNERVYRTIYATKAPARRDDIA